MWIGSVHTFVVASVALFLIEFGDLFKQACLLHHEIIKVHVNELLSHFFISTQNLSIRNNTQNTKAVHSGSSHR